MQTVETSYLILHGLENHRPPEHWQFWLAAKLAELHHQVLYPALPEPDAPSFDAWTAAMRAGLRELDTSGQRIVLCHSLACLLWMKAAPQIAPEERPDRVLLVGPPSAARLPETGREFIPEPLDAAAVRASVTGDIAIVTSDDDPYNPPGADGQDFGALLDIPTTVIPDGGHLNPEAGYGTWPFVFDWAVGRGSR